MKIMNLIICILIITIENLNAELIENKSSCNYHDTVDLSSSISFPNGSYLYDGILIPKKYVQIYNYQIINLTKRITVEPHNRGCICLVKTCLKLCCNGINDILSKTTCDPVNHSLVTELEITTHSNTFQTVNIFEYFTLQKNRKPSCKSLYDLNPEAYAYDKWQLFENGSLYRLDDNYLFGNDEFCFGHTYLHADGNENILAPFICSLDEVDTIRRHLYAYAMMFSIPFMLITVIIYIVIPELRNLHGKSLTCYLSALIVSYAIFSYLLITSGNYVSHTTCTILGFSSYFFFMLSFFWLSVISFDLYWNFRGTILSRRKDTKRFLLYGLYAWGLAGCFLAFTIFAEYSDLVPIKYKPGIGSDLYCFLDVKTNFSATIYFYGPIMCLIIFNSVMFTLTSWKIYHVQREMSRMIAREDSRRNLNTQQHQFGLFLRLFLVMGVTWSAEIMSYFLSHSMSELFYITDCLNLIQGFLIFAVFVLKAKVKTLIIRRFTNQSLNRSSLNSTKTQRSNLGTTPRNTLTLENPLMDKN